jgi:kynurenine formamidase
MRSPLPVAVALLLALGLLRAPLDAQAPARVPKAQVEQWMKDLSNWGRWGKDDQRGTLNLITPAKRKQALRLVKDGAAVSLAHPLDRGLFPDNPRPIRAAMTLDNGGHAMDLYSIWYHGSTITHLDALCHYSHEGVLYNNLPKSAITPETGCGVLGVEHQQDGWITRGVVVDIPLMKGVPYLDPGDGITDADLDAWEKFSGVRIEPGDAVFVRTGRWARRQALGPWNVAQQAAGLHITAMPWLKQRDVALLGSDGVQDVLPSGVEGFGRPIHLLSIVTLGMPLIDVMDLETVAAESARRKQWAFMVTLAPAPVPGGTGFPVNPIALF